MVDEIIVEGADRKPTWRDLVIVRFFLLPLSLLQMLTGASQKKESDPAPAGSESASAGAGDVAAQGDKARKQKKV